MLSATTRILLPAGRGGLLSLPGITPASAAAASERLTQNHRGHHAFFNIQGYHNHITHHLLALYDLGAPAAVLNTAYTQESTYQRPLPPITAPVDSFGSAQWKSQRGKLENYSSFLSYFEREIDARGVPAVVNETLFSGGEEPDDMLVRLFSGFLHPFIHVGYGLEFSQPAVVAEGLAQAAVHERWIGELLLGAEEKAVGKKDTAKTTLVGLMDSIREDEKLRTAPMWEDGNKVKGVLERAKEEMLEYASRYQVPVVKIEEKMAESINAAALFTAASQREDKEIRIDFYYMHAHNSSIFLPSFICQPWISDAAKARLLEWKGRHDLALYASRRAPELRVNDIRNYVPKEKNVTNPWLNIFDRTLRVHDDGHTVKFVRACANGERVCAPWQDHEDRGFVVKGDMWIKIAQMCIDSVEEEGERWARSVGFDEAWENYGPRRKY